MIQVRGSEDKREIRITCETDTEAMQVTTVLQALDIFSAKNATYNDAWSKYGSYGAAFFIMDRAERIWQMMTEQHQMNPEDCLDLINLCCFCIRSQMVGNIGGQRWPKLNEAGGNIPPRD